jgi:hypothetical protein
MYNNNRYKNSSDLKQIDVTGYVESFLLELAKRERRSSIKITKLSDVERIKGLLNLPKNTAFKSLSDIRTNIPFWERQEVDYIKSNLGKGYIFYFLCNICGRRVKYLYNYNEYSSPKCRICCDLRYKSPTRKDRSLSRWSKKPYLSSEDRYMMAKRFGIKKEDVPEEKRNSLNNSEI